MRTASASRKRNKAYCLALAWLLALNTVFGQDTATADQLQRLDTLKTHTQLYCYSPGQQERAATIAVFLEDAVKYFQEEIVFTPQTVFYILSPQHWKQYAATPFHEVYGFPHNIDHVHLAVAAADNDFWRSFLPPVDQLPPAMFRQVTTAYGKADGSYSMMPFFDLLALHEMGHSYTAQAGLEMQRHWMGELFVNIMLHTYIAEKRPELLPALETFPEMVVAGGTEGLQFTSLEDFERLYSTMGMGPKNYGWYQSKLHVAAKDIYNAGGKEVLRKLWTALKDHRKVLTDEALTEMLKNEVHPSVADVYLKWGK